MGKVFKNQTALKIVLETGYIFLGTETVYINYKKPSGLTGKFTAFISGSTIFYYIQSSAELNEYGNWEFWSEIHFVDGTIVRGEKAIQVINK